MTARLAILLAGCSAAATVAAAEEGSWTLVAEAPAIAVAAMPQDIALHPRSSGPPAGAVVRAMSWSWSYPAATSTVPARICIARRCLESSEESVHGDGTLAGTPLDEAPVMSVRINGAPGEPIGPVVGAPVTLTVEWVHR